MNYAKEHKKRPHSYLEKIQDIETQSKLKLNEVSRVRAQHRRSTKSPDKLCCGLRDVLLTGRTLTNRKSNQEYINNEQHYFSIYAHKSLLLMYGNCANVSLV